MLLRYLVLFLNVLVAASEETVTPVPGWDPKREHGPRIGGVYLREYAMTGEGLQYDPFVVIHSVQQNYRVVRMSDSESSDPRFAGSIFPDARLATDFFNEVELQSSNDIKKYVFPRERHDVECDPKILRIRPGHLTIISEEGLDRLIAASDGLVVGWHESLEKPVRGTVYWLLPRDLGHKHYRPRHYIPCVFIGKDGGKCIVVCMFKDIHGVPAKDFFGNNVLMLTPLGQVNLNNYNIIPSRWYAVEANPKIMQLCNSFILKMSYENVNILSSIKKEPPVHHFVGQHQKKPNHRF